MGLNEVDRRIPIETLAVIRTILVKSLSRENLSETDLKREFYISNNDKHQRHTNHQRESRQLVRRMDNNNTGNKDAAVKQQPPRPASATREIHNNMNHNTLHWFACVGGGDQDYQNIVSHHETHKNEFEEDTNHEITGDEAETSTMHKDREERIKQKKEKENEDRQKKLEELKAQALAAQKFREQKEEERRRRMEDLRNRENDRRVQVEERKKAIWEAEKERREYIMRKEQERQARLDSKRKNERSQIQFAFGSSTPRMAENVDCSGMSMSSSFWATRRATSTTNMACNNTALTRRSSERELGGDSKKRATSASGLDRQTEAHRQMSSSMHEIFNWDGPRPAKMTFSLAGSSINIDDPSPTEGAYGKDDSVDSQANYQRANRRKTDLMPTIPSPRDSSRTSFGTHTPRTPARAFSMTRLDQLAQPVRRNGEHIRAIIERERRQALEIENLSRLSLSRHSPTATSNQKRKSRSMSQLARNNVKRDLSTGSVGGTQARKPKVGSPLHGAMRKSDTSKSMSQLSDDGEKGRARMERSRKLRQQVKEQLSNSSVTGLRSGEITPTSHNTSNSRPGSAMSNSTNASGVIYRRTTPQARKPRPASIAVTGVTPNVHKDESAETKRPPLPKSSISKRPASATATPTSKTTTGAEPKKIEKPRSAKATPGITPKGTTPIISPTPDSANKTMEQTIKQTSTTTELVQTKENTNNETIVVEKTEVVQETVTTVNGEPLIDITEQVIEAKNKEQAFDQVPESVAPSAPAETAAELVVDTSGIDLENADMSSSMMAKSKIITEEEAKAALAERRRIAREEAERQAELERQRLEQERLEQERLEREEEERLKKLEEETIRLAEEQRRLEEERLQQAIEEAKKKEMEEQQKRDEEARLKAEREEQERKAKEEAEKTRIETAERLKKEEKEREERRKRVEAIMARTRKAGPNNTPNKTNEGDDKTGAGNETMTMSQSLTESMMQELNDAEQQQESESQQQPQESNATTTTITETTMIVTSGNDGDAQSHYENSVTEKENLLISSFNKIVTLNNGESGQEQDQGDGGVHHNTNGKNTDVMQLDMTTTELIIQDAINNTQQNGHKNGSFDDVLKPIPVSDTKLAAQDLITGQLIDFNATQTTTDSQMNINDPLLSFNNNNNNNNNLANTTTSTPLVASDSQDNRDLSLL